MGCPSRHRRSHRCGSSRCMARQDIRVRDANNRRTMSGGHVLTDLRIPPTYGLAPPQIINQHIADAMRIHPMQHRSQCLQREHLT